MNEFQQKQQGLIPRLTDQTFKLDTSIGDGIFSAEYFIKTQKILKDYYQDNQPKVLLQFFQRKHAVLCGIDECLAVIKKFATNYADIEIKALNDGDIITPFEPVLTLKGHYIDFGYLEGIIDGILARRTSITTNTYKLKKLIHQGQDIIFMGDREDYCFNQIGDGYACFIGGVEKQATEAMGLWTGNKGLGTMPHALIQNLGGDIILACEQYVKAFPDSPLVALIDYNNDVVTDSIKVARYFGKKLHAVRVDTSPTMVDKVFMQEPCPLGKFDPRGVNVELIKTLRITLDKEGFDHVQIIASGNFNETKLKHFVDEKAPVDLYGIGSSILKINIGFTGDCVELNSTPCAKLGRNVLSDERLTKVN